MNNPALILLSGGQDSTTALCWAMEKFTDVSAISFDFGQTHAIELESAKIIAQKCSISHEVIELQSIFKNVPHCDLLDKAEEGSASPHFPATFVPGRNLLFLNTAAIYAFSRGIRDLVIGVSQVDYSGYPDCREEFLQSAEQTISLAMDEKFTIHAPFLFCSKAEEIQLMQSMGTLDLLSFTHTCYRGKKPPCGKCDACALRAKGFEEAGIEDPIIKNKS